MENKNLKCSTNTHLECSTVHLEKRCFCFKFGHNCVFQQNNYPKTHKNSFLSKLISSCRSGLPKASTFSRGLLWKICGLWLKVGLCQLANPAERVVKYPDRIVPEAC